MIGDDIVKPKFIGEYSLCTRKSIWNTHYPNADALNESSLKCHVISLIDFPNTQQRKH